MVLHPVPFTPMTCHGHAADTHRHNQAEQDLTHTVWLELTLRRFLVLLIPFVRRTVLLDMLGRCLLVFLIPLVWRTVLLGMGGGSGGRF